jgi:hypothetical protein
MWWGKAKTKESRKKLATALNPREKPFFAAKKDFTPKPD